jgi:Fur family zinc uptake transcriptional regulator
MPAGLTSNQRSVLGALRARGTCRTAYELLDELRGSGFAAATSVYRALDALTAQGLVHRVESLNAFVACRHDPHATAPVLAICRDCGHVDELDPIGLTDLVDRWCDTARFRPERVTIEIIGRCEPCGTESSGPAVPVP